MERFIVDQAWRNVVMNEKCKRCIEKSLFHTLGERRKYALDAFGEEAISHFHHEGPVCIWPVKGKGTIVYPKPEGEKDTPDEVLDVLLRKWCNMTIQEYKNNR